MEKVFGRYNANIQSVSRLCIKKVAGRKASSRRARALSDAFDEKDGRRPRILVAKLGQDLSDRGAKVIANAFADIGFDVDISPLFLTPQEAAKQAVEMMCMWSEFHHSPVDIKHCPQVIAALKEFRREDILVIVGGVIPKRLCIFTGGRRCLYFGPGTVIGEMRPLLPFESADAEIEVTIASWKQIRFQKISPMVWTINS